MARAAAGPAAHLRLDQSASPEDQSCSIFCESHDVFATFLPRTSADALRTQLLLGGQHVLAPAERQRLVDTTVEAHEDIQLTARQREHGTYSYELGTVRSLDTLPRPLSVRATVKLAPQDLGRPAPEGSVIARVVTERSP
jgi:hypothetical protein